MRYEKRATLHRSKLDEFKAWLVADGWELGKLGDYQVINAKKGKERFCAYDRNRGEHFTVQRDMLPVVGRFLNVEVDDGLEDWANREMGIERHWKD